MRLPVQKNSKKLKATVIFLLAMLIAGFTIFLAIGVNERRKRK
jgi:hypothetical protein